MKTIAFLISLAGSIALLSLFTLAGNAPPGPVDITCEQIDGLNKAQLKSLIINYEQITETQPQNNEAKVLLACLYHKLGRVLYNTDVPESYENCLKAFHVRDQLIREGIRSDTDLLTRTANLCHNLSKFLQEKQSYYEAKGFSEKAIAIYEKLGLKTPSVIHRQLGIVLEDMGDYSRALEEYDAALRLVTSAGDSAKAYLAQASALNFIDRPDSAEKVLRLAKPRIKDKNDMYVYFESLGKSFDFRKRHSEAQKSYLEALRYCSGDGFFKTYLALGRSYRLDKNLPKSKEACQKALKDALTADHKAAALDAFGEIALMENDADAALRYFRAAQDTLLSGKTAQYRQGQLDDVVPKSDFFNMLLDEGRAYARMRGKEFEAIRAFEQADSLLFYMRQEHHRESSKLEWRKKTKSLYEKALSMCLRIKDYNRASYFFEHSKSVLLSDALAELNASSILGHELDSIQNTLQSKLGQARQAYQSNPSSDTLLELLTKTQKDYDRFIDTLAQKSPEYARLIYENHVLSMEDMKRHLSLGMCMIHYFWGDSGIYVLKFDKQFDSAFFRVDAPKEIEAAIARFSNWSKTGTTDKAAYAKLGHALYTTLLAPCFPNGMDATKVAIIAPDGPIACIPWDALSTTPLVQGPDGLTNKSWLLFSLQTQTAFSGTALWQWPHQAPADKTRMAFFAPVSFRSGLAPLHESEELNGKLGQLIPAEQYRSYMKDSANSTALFHCREASVVHFHAHSVVDSIKGPRLFLFDRAIEMEDFYQWQGNADLLVIGSCESNVGNYYSGEGVYSLNRAFSIAGVPSIISSLWKVPENSTRHLMYAFYEGLCQGKTKLEALHDAKITFIEQYPDAASPANWAAWTFTGYDNPIALSKRHTPIWYWCVGIGLMLGVLSWLLYRRFQRQ